MILVLSSAWDTACQFWIPNSNFWGIARGFWSITSIKDTSTPRLCLSRVCCHFDKSHIDTTPRWIPWLVLKCILADGLMDEIHGVGEPIVGSLFFFTYIVFVAGDFGKNRATSGTGAFPPFQIFRRAEGFHSLQVLSSFSNLVARLGARGRSFNNLALHIQLIWSPSHKTQLRFRRGRSLVVCSRLELRVFVCFCGILGVKWWNLKRNETQTFIASWIYIHGINEVSGLHDQQERLRSMENLLATGMKDDPCGKALQVFCRCVTWLGYDTCSGHLTCIIIMHFLNFPSPFVIPLLLYFFM